MDKVFHMKGSDLDQRYVALCGSNISDKGAKEWLTDENKRVNCEECLKQLPKSASAEEAPLEKKADQPQKKK